MAREHLLPIDDVLVALAHRTALQGRQIAAEAGLRDERWSWSYQSAGRSPEPWLGPALDEHLAVLAEQGALDDTILRKTGKRIAGALEEKDYVRKLEAAGFVEAGIEPTRIYKTEDAREFLKEKNLDLSAIAEQVDEKFMSGFVRAKKPLT